MKVRHQVGAFGVRPIDVEEFAAGLVDAFVGVGAEEVALALEEVLGEAFGAVAVVVGEGAGEAGHGDAVFGTEGDDRGASCPGRWRFGR